MPFVVNVKKGRCRLCLRLFDVRVFKNLDYEIVNSKLKTESNMIKFAKFDCSRTLNLEKFENIKIYHSKTFFNMHFECHQKNVEYQIFENINQKI